MPTIQEVRHANLLLLLAEYPTVQAFANAIGRSHSQVSQYKNRNRHSTAKTARTIGDDFARHVELKIGKPSGWMDTQHTDEGARPRGEVSQVLRLPPLSHSPLLIWGENMKNPLPPEFHVAVPDDSMAPRVRRGDVVKFATGVVPRPGDGVLVQDQDGSMYFRIYRERRPGQWEAYPLNEAYQPLESVRDGLTVLAVLTGLPEQRWG